MMMSDTELTERLNHLLLETANAFLRMAQEHHRGPARAAEFEISVAVRRRAMLVPQGD
jgi:hypothetical protein